MDRISELKRIGFTEYEAKVYLALLKEAPATGYQLSKESDVPRSMVYETLRRLHSRGVVLETVEDRATLYRPLPPDTLIDSLEVEHKQLIKSLRSGLQQLFTTTEDDHVWSISGHSAIYTYAGKLISTATAPLFLVLPDEGLEALRSDIDAAHSAGHEIHALLTGEGELNLGRVVRHPPLESELQELEGTLLVAVDGEEVLIASSTGAGRTATVTRNPDLVLIARQFVWMEMFTQRIYAKLAPEFIKQLDPEDQAIFASMENAK
ncbi:MAG: TrmB family transcriptional regulator [Candidatus Promineifilaceae bacterium]